MFLKRRSKEKVYYLVFIFFSKIINIKIQILVYIKKYFLNYFMSLHIFNMLCQNNAITENNENLFFKNKNYLIKMSSLK